MKYIYSLFIIFITKIAFASIIVTVNNNAITDLDIHKRVTLLRAIDKNLTKIDDYKLKSIALEQLIDEEIYLIDGKKNKIKVDKAEIDKTKRYIEEQNSLKQNELSLFLKYHKIDNEHFEKHLNAQLTWQKIVAEKIRPFIRIEDHEIEKFVTNPNFVRLKANIFSADYSQENVNSFAKLRNKSTDCNSFKKNFSGFEMNEFNSKMSDLNEFLLSRTFFIESGNSSPIINFNNKIYVVSVCERKIDIEKSEKSKLIEQLSFNKLETKMNLYLNKIKKENYIHYKK